MDKPFFVVVAAPLAILVVTTINIMVTDESASTAMAVAAASILGLQVLGLVLMVRNNRRERL